ncbi:tRNA (adenosine(37)-N6)-threonylcarbamoyltransferase complex dimerization subunit type 1 TsaB [Lacibacter sp.]|uniref:tRNA (adenosine(37)-N6)-threonylcarbamoyltransferase complex dimerization subunit type 1 TsaB n=1 Tax=Lacibacter sp. TaxID=1915409 RepID=UPI002B4B293F|nr:tRNA (adenosine(37)-N6)-threonylcarbamoyltransferase complex dimerization subunit type 1 TsaB [Lacibacter sp.]HLP37867.1 tRNA (adenosine(37)-N6)-threonylcarbamoyltransferase complex dimerization subunit type 1 TsaB [Lacibacter sp.]
MALLLCIDTSTTHASVALAKDGVLIGMKANQNQRDHASFLQPAVHSLLQEANQTLKDLDAIAVTSGPGSYTGLRVGFASAKGLAYALDIPLISVETTLVMSAAASTILKNEEAALLCPMIDARRMEVFTALYSADLKPVSSISALILNSDSFVRQLENSRIFFFGDGAPKWQIICTHSNAFFLDVKWTAGDMVGLADKLFEQKSFSSLAYSVPVYGKEFHSTQI